MPTWEDFANRGSYIYNLKVLPTRVLLDYLQRARESQGWYDPTGNHGAMIPDSAIKTELATREHVMSKPEGKEYRRDKAKGSGVRGRADRRRGRGNR